MKTSWESVTVDQNPMGLYLCQPDGSGPFPAVIVAQNQDGVAAFTQEMTRRVAAAGYIAIAPQFYHREGEPKTPQDTANIFNRSGWKGYRPQADAASWARTLEFFSKYLSVTTTRVAAAG